jgi:hypothetical protein
VELLAARAMAMMLSLSVFSKFPFIDHIALVPGCQLLAKQIVDRALQMAGMQMDPRCSVAVKVVV